MLTYEQAVSVLPDDDMIHTYFSIPMSLIGGDWERERILEAIRSGKPQIGGEACRREGHGLVIFTDISLLGIKAEEPLFIETRDGAIDKLEKDIKGE
jgi:hypothetical protein